MTDAPPCVPEDPSAGILRDLPPLAYAAPRPVHRLEYGAFRAFGALFRVLPEGAAMGLVRGLADAACLALRRRSRLARASIGEALGLDPGGAQAAAIIRLSCRNFAENWVVLVRMDRLARAGRARFRLGEGGGILAGARRAGRGLVIATGHFGHWEAGSLAMGLCGHPCASIAAVQHNPLFDRWVNGRRETGGGRILHNRLGVRHAIPLLRAGGRLAILSDVDVGGHGVFAPFLGRPASTLRWPAELALRTGSLLVVGAMLPAADGTETMRFSPPMEPAASGSGEAAVLALATEMNRRLSDFVRADPGRWFWFQRRWKTPPPEGGIPPRP